MLKKFKTLAYLLGLILSIHFLTIYLWATKHTNTLVQFYPSDNSVTVTPQQRKIFLTVEDPDFDKHIGISLANGQGLTTITSSVAREVFYNGLQLDGFGGALQSLYRSIFNCCKRVDFGRDLMAVALNNQLSKDQQLSLYLMTVYMGEFEGVQVRGFEEAARIYYDKTLNQLNNVEFIGLVAMPILPNYYHPKKNTEIHAERAQRIEKLISEKCSPQGWLDIKYTACEENNY